MSHCSGVIELEVGIAPCFKEIKPEEAIRLYFEKGGMIHDLYFCSFQCLATWLRHSQWEKI